MSTFKPIRWTEKRRRTLEQLVDAVFVYGLCSTQGRLAARSEYMDETTPEMFSECELLLDDGAADIGSHEVGYFIDAKPDDFPRSQWDASSVNFHRDEEVGEVMILNRFRSVSLKRARGLGRLKSPWCGELSQCVVQIDQGVFRGKKAIVNRCGGGKWHDLSATQIGENGYMDFVRVRSSWGNGSSIQTIAQFEPERDDLNAQVLLGIAFNRDLLWRVVIKSQGKFSISLPTDACGAMAAFRHRDPNTETGRRDALRNWVSEHYRTTRSPVGDERLVKVRQHLRGRTPFRWLGMDCELVVAPFDERFNARLAEEKAEVRRQRGYEPLESTP